MGKVYEFIFKNFNNSIRLKDVAEIANMNKSAFSRLFKRINKKPFSKYLNEIRIGYACKLLTENKYNISTICYESGFNNISNFNKQFKTVTSLTPSEYLTKHIKNQPKRYFEIKSNKAKKSITYCHSFGRYLFLVELNLPSKKICLTI